MPQQSLASLTKSTVCLHSTHTRTSHPSRPAARPAGPCPRFPAPACRERRCQPRAAASAPWTSYEETLCSCSTEVENKTY